MHDLTTLRPWLDSVMATCADEVHYGFSSIGEFLPETLKAYPRAVTLVLHMDDAIMDSIATGPHAEYYAEYGRVNSVLDELSRTIAERLESESYEAHPVASSKRIDYKNILGEFPHKTGAVLAGLGWIGRSSLLISKAFGPRVRLGTVLTNAPLGSSSGVPSLKSRCGSCARCVEACPAQAITGAPWRPGMPRKELINAKTCEDWKMKHYSQFDGMVCGICVSVCPYGQKKKKAAKANVM